MAFSRKVKRRVESLVAWLVALIVLALIVMGLLVVVGYFASPL